MNKTEQIHQAYKINRRAIFSALLAGNITMFRYHDAAIWRGTLELIKKHGETEAAILIMGWEAEL